MPAIHAASHASTMKKELHSFLFLCMHVVPVPTVMVLCLVALCVAGAPPLIFNEEA